MGLAHLSCLVRQGEMAVKEKEEWNTGEGIMKWQKCFDCGQGFHGPLMLALGWACWKTYAGRPESDQYRCSGMGVLGNAFYTNQRSAEALAVFEVNLAVRRRFFSQHEITILITQTNIAGCLKQLGRLDEAHVLERKIYARRVATLGASNERTLLSGSNLLISLDKLRRYDEVTSFARDLLPVARQSLGADHTITLNISQSLAAALQSNPQRTCDDLRLNQTSRDATRLLNFNTGKDLLEAEAVLDDLIQRRRRVFGPAHPTTLHIEQNLRVVRASSLLNSAS